MSCAAVPSMTPLVPPFLPCSLLASSILTGLSQLWWCSRTERWTTMLCRSTASRWPRRVPAGSASTCTRGARTSTSPRTSPTLRRSSLSPRTTRQPTAPSTAAPGCTCSTVTCRAHRTLAPPLAVLGAFRISSSTGTRRWAAWRADRPRTSGCGAAGTRGR